MTYVHRTAIGVVIPHATQPVRTTTAEFGHLLDSAQYVVLQRRPEAFVFGQYCTPLVTGYLHTNAAIEAIANRLRGTLHG